MTSFPQNGSVCFKLHGSLAVAAIAQHADSELRLWCLSRMIDGAGSGVVDDHVLRDAVGRYIGVSERQVSRLLVECKRRGWLALVKRHSDGRRVRYIASLERVARSLGVEDVTRPALIPVSDLRKLKGWRDACWAAFRAVGPRMISRRKLADLSGIDARSQFNYERENERIEVQNNIAITSMPSMLLDGIVEFDERPAFRCGRSVAWVIPNSYKCTVDLAALGMAKRVSGYLRAGGVLNNYAATRSGQHRQRLFYGYVKSGEQAMRREHRPHEVYGAMRYKIGDRVLHKRTRGGAGVYVHMAA